MTPMLPLAVAAIADIPPWLIAPFALWLLLIATMPLSPPRLKRLWERYYPHLAVGLAVVMGIYYGVKIPRGSETLTYTAHEYFSFIALIGALFVVAGGIHLKVRGETTPLENVVFLASGAVLANFIGTTGASMVLIRPWLRMNQIRIRPYHVVFFIFVVSNVGGALTPIGDPPLFLGYLSGVPFFWLVKHVAVQWMVTLGLVLAAFYGFDRRAFRRLARPLRRVVEQDRETWRFEGRLNGIFLLVIIGAVFLPETWFLREIVMLGAAAASYGFTPEHVHRENAFNFAPIREVAFLFIGIFATMMPALGYLEQHGPAFGFDKPIQYYFGSGALSSVLDNAPTYVNFLALAQATAAGEHPAALAGTEADGRAAVGALLREKPLFVIAVSLGSVFFGAMTYIGNGPNFMVKSIAQEVGVLCPSFFGYMAKFSLPVLLPILALIGWIFLG